MTIHRLVACLALVMALVSAGACAPSRPTSPGLPPLTVAPYPQVVMVAGDGKEQSFTAAGGNGQYVWRISKDNNQPGPILGCGTGSSCKVSNLAVGSYAMTVSSGAESLTVTIQVVPPTFTLP